jgi:hypothetical protein
MRTNPFFDALGFLTQGDWTSYVFGLLTIASIVIAAVNLRHDSSQRSVLHLWNWLVRFFIGALWWQQSLWKLPPTYTDNPDGSGGLRYWMGEMAKWGQYGAAAALRERSSASAFLLLRATSLLLRGADRRHADPWTIQPVGIFLRSTDGHQSLAGPLSFPRRVALDVLLPHCCPDHAPGSTTRTQFGFGCYPAAT